MKRKALDGSGGQQKSKKAKTSANGNAGPSHESGASKEEQNFSTSLRRSFQYLLKRDSIERPPGHIQARVQMSMPLPASEKHKERVLLSLVPPIAPTNSEEIQELRKKGTVVDEATGVLEVYLTKHYPSNLDVLRPHTIIKLSLKGARFEKIANPKHLFPKRLFFSEGFHIRFGDNEINTFTGPPIDSNTRGLVAEPEPKAPCTKDHISSQKHVLDVQPKKEEDTAPLGGQLPEQPQAVKPSVESDPPPEPQPIASKHVSSPSTSAILTPVQSAPGTPMAQPNATKTENPLASPVRHSPAPDTLSLRPPREYRDIGSLNLEQKNRSLSVIGIVTEFQDAKQSRTRDWFTKIRIVDPTNFSRHNRSSGLPLMFFGTEKRNVPHPAVGDILVAKRVKIDDFSGNLQGVGPRDSFQWAMFSQETRQIYFDKDNGANAIHSMDINHPTIYTQVQPDELAYCERLMDWWRETHEKQQAEANETRVESSSVHRPQRSHRLISELTFDPGKNEYFDCTVEVLRMFPQDSNGTCMLLVTDYTRNQHSYEVTADWCPTALAPYVFQIDCWDRAAEFASNMKEKCYYSLSNTRKKLSKAGYLEGKQVEARMVLLDPETTESENLKALLERKKQFEKETGCVAEEFEDQLFKDAEIDRFFHCTVEILHTEYVEGKTATVFCTDYTSRTDLGGYPSKADWAKGLENRIAKFVLTDGQTQIAQSVKRGDFCRFNKMRLRSDYRHGYIIGYMGGRQVLMEKLNPKNKENKLLQDLFKRKRGLDVAKMNNFTFQEILDSQTLNEKFRVFARVVHYEPRNLDEAIYLWCAKCDRKLGAVEKMCINCEGNDALEGRCDLVLTVEDRDFGRVLLTVPEKSLIFQDLDLSRYMDEDGVKKQVRERLKPFIGLYCHGNRNARINGSLVGMEVVVFNDKSEGISFALFDAAPRPE